MDENASPLTIHPATPLPMHPSKPWRSVRLQRFPISFRVDQRVAGVLTILIGVASLALVVNVSRGEYPVPLWDVVKTIVGLPTTSDYAFVVNTLRLPRALIALLVGMGLATAGTILQGLTRNPLVAPGIIGINSGASLVAVAFIVLWPGLPVGWLPLADRKSVV